MRKPTRCAVVALVSSAGLAMAACAGEPATAEAPQPATVQEASGSQAPLITVTEQGAERTGIETTTVGSESTLSVPYSALLYDPSGDTWVYVSPEPLTYTRHPVTVEDIDGDLVLLAAGPPPGTEVVTVGVAELWGAENGIGQ
jgi:hypothetical protein